MKIQRFALAQWKSLDYVQLKKYSNQLKIKKKKDKETKGKILEQQGISISVHDEISV